jgi:protein-S-isoprenylcysteine O-methyltransferase Ste14
MRPMPFLHPAAGLIFWIAIAFLGATQIWIASANLLNRVRSAGVPHTRLDRGSLVVVMMTSGVAIGTAFQVATSVPGAAIAPGVPAVRWVLLVVGVATIVAGALLRQWAIITLGRYFTLDVRITDGQPVVDSGPYRWIRHPSYIGLIAAFIGIGLALGNWFSLLLLLVVPTIGLVFRVHVEEAALLTNLGEPYRRYAARRKRLLPGLW